MLRKIGAYKHDNCVFVVVRESAMAEENGYNRARQNNNGSNNDNV